MRHSTSSSLAVAVGHHPILQVARQGKVHGTLGIAYSDGGCDSGAEGGGEGSGDRAGGSRGDDDGGGGGRGGDGGDGGGGTATVFVGCWPSSLAATSAKFVAIGSVSCRVGVFSLAFGISAVEG
ncbi:hypothetical protein CBR_g23835 [Chara braunii]|uniref:Uncharacterized protein n=1 Tax=Chara braunii TaxID=69332 RepID=A0A388JVN5_CHABU|nr:hypothetical protein CBR_g23835 [Chara braunii]|eukprot:GBG61884.1 hypothetical protein CBR_g23835 [Chara braunii]